MDTTAPPPLGLTYEAHLVLTPRAPERHPLSWAITHPLGGPAGNTYTEVVLPCHLEGIEHETVDALVRRIAVDLYGDRWAFTYPPERFETAIGEHGSRRREVVVVDSFATWAS